MVVMVKSEIMAFREILGGQAHQVLLGEEEQEIATRPCKLCRVLMELMELWDRRGRQDRLVPWA